jgi:hypothetical protein
VELVERGEGGEGERRRGGEGRRRKEEEEEEEDYAHEEEKKELLNYSQCPDMIATRKDGFEDVEFLYGAGALGGGADYENEDRGRVSELLQSLDRCWCCWCWWRADDCSNRWWEIEGRGGRGFFVGLI